MQHKFCGKCGKPVAQCICGASRHESTDFNNNRSGYDLPSRKSDFYIQRFGRIALTQGEVVVRQYHIGEFDKLLKFLGRGSAHVIITNKRVICKQDSNYLGTSSTSVEEIALESIAGVKNYYYRGFTIWRLIIAVVFAITALFFMFNHPYRFNFGQFFLGLVIAGISAIMFIKSRKPSYLFSVYSSTATPVMTTAVNMLGKLLNAGGVGIVFQYKPTQAAVQMMCEMGACIMDLKNKGDYAIDAWKDA